ncbi:MAG: UvrD-helicase domain-containing protein [Bacteroidales bacterium]|nr:UvrD-helicase domain-containing protein [Bacteroidales bacterium]
MENGSRNFVICKASAGAGKTFTLVKEYISQAFDAADDRELATRFAHILAITFTNKAAGEMKERIMGELAAMAAGKNTPMAAEVAKQVGLGPAEVAGRAAIVHSAILHSYSDLAVCTIDSFMHRIVRTFAHDLGLPMNFEIMINHEALVTDTVAELLARTGADGQQALTEVLRRFAESRMEEGKSYEVEAELKELATDLLKEDSQTRIDALGNFSLDDFCQINNQYSRLNREFEAAVAQAATEALTAIESHGLTDDDFYQKSKGIVGFFRKLATGTYAPAGAHARAAIEQNKLAAAKCSPQTQAAIEAIWPTIVEAYNNCNKLLDSQLQRYNTRRALQRHLFAMALMGQLQTISRQYSRDNEIVHISEFNKQIFDIVQTEPAPFIYERLGDRYRNYLIDEFQDTSRLQWQDLVPLIENGIASGNRSLVVGDGKQAIYRFRQGDVKQFVDLPRVDSPLHGRLLAAPGTAAFAHLLQNRRTGRNIVEFNNNFFAWAARTRFATNDELQAIYVGNTTDGAARENGNEELRQQPVRDGGCVELELVPHTKGHPAALGAVANAVKRALEAGFSPHDITIIARDKATLAAVSAALAEHLPDLKITSAESFLLTGSNTAMLIVALLRWIAAPDDRLAACQVAERLALAGLAPSANSQQLGVGRTDLGPLLEAAGLRLDPDSLRAMSLYDCCEELLRSLGPQASADPYAASLLNAVATFATLNRQDIGTFLEWFDQQSGSLSTQTSSDLDAVNLMTIHKAKGLEARVIILPLLNRKEPNSELWVSVDDPELRLPVGLVSLNTNTSTNFDTQRDAELAKREIDNLNLLYVALTRPRDLLAIVSEEASDKDTTSFRALLRDYAATTPSAKIEPGHYRWGETPVPQQLAPANNSATKLRRVAFPNWNGRIAIAAQSDTALTPLVEERIRLGLRLHAALALVTDAQSLPQALAQYSASQKLPPAESQALGQKLHTLVNHPLCAPFFDPQWQVRNECDLVFGGRLLRPDRIVTRNDQAWVIDYKTGTPLPEHSIQVAQYCQAMLAMGYSQVRGFVLYTTGPEVTEITLPPNHR